MAETVDVGPIDADEGAVCLDALDDSLDDLALGKVAELERNRLHFRIFAETELDLVLHLVDPAGVRENGQRQLRLGPGNQAYAVILPSTS